LNGHPRVNAVDWMATTEKSRAEVQRVLGGYGARRFSYVRDRTTERIILSFVLPESPAAGAQEMLVQLAIDLRRVYGRLYGPSRSLAPHESDSQRLEHAERAAWHHLLQWMEGAVAAASAGLQTIAEAFFAHRVVTLGDGGRARLVDYLESEQTYLGAGIRALLATPVEGV
jgi:hypothetical protein